MDDPINWHDLEIFHAVLEKGSFSGAARALEQHARQMSEGMFGIRRVLDGGEETPQGMVTISLPHGIGRQ